MIRTVLGDVEVADLGPDLLGAVNTHEHVFQVSPLLPGDELDDVAASTAELSLLRESGFSAMIDATPIGLGRRPRDLPAISRDTGVVIIATTGLHRGEHYPAGHPVRAWTVADRAAAFESDVTTGMTEPGSDTSVESDDAPRAGVIKAGIGYWSISAFERATLEAAAQAHAATGRPLLIHLEHGTAAHEVLDVLDGLGVSAGAVLLAHADRLLDAGLHAELMARGAWLGYDGAARARSHSDESLIDLTERALAAGVNRILLGGDVARATRYAAYGGMPGLAYLGDRYVPRLEERIGAAALREILVTNPVAYLDRPIP